jgi:hypothetical protein
VRYSFAFSLWLSVWSIGGLRPRYITLPNANQTKMIRLSSIAFSLLLAFCFGNSANAQPKTPRAIESGSTQTLARTSATSARCGTWLREAATIRVRKTLAERRVSAVVVRLGTAPISLCVSLRPLRLCGKRSHKTINRRGAEVAEIRREIRCYEFMNRAIVLII